MYCKISNISPGLIEVSKQFRGLVFGVIIFVGHFVAVSDNNPNIILKISLLHIVIF